MINYHLLPQFRPARLQDLVLWYEPWSFRERTWHNLAPCFSDRNHGTAYGDIGLSTWHPQFAPAPTFYGSSQYIKVPSFTAVDGLNTVTLEFWLAYFVDGEEDTYIDAISGGISKFIVDDSVGDDGLRVNWYDGEAAIVVDYPTSLGKGILHHCSAVLDKTVSYLYINAVKVKSAFNPSFTAIPHSDEALYIAGVYRSRYTIGKIPLVRIYRSALSQTEVMHNYTHHPLYLLQRGIDPYMFVKKGGIYYVM